MITVKKPTATEITKCKTWPIWQKERSKFNWHYSEKETCLILEGKATVSTKTEKVTFTKGDIVIFPEGIDCTWEIIEPIKKHYSFG